MRPLQKRERRYQLQLINKCALEQALRAFTNQATQALPTRRHMSTSNSDASDKLWRAAGRTARVGV